MPRKETDNKVAKLRNLLQEMESVLIGFSGGTDSSYLLAVARDVLGDNARAAIATGPIYPAYEVDQARRFADALGVELIEKNNEAVDGELFSSNPPDRCYHCKLWVFGALREIADSLDLAWVADGSNLDDLGDYRPGQRALTELAIRSPLLEAGFAKADVRAESKKLGLPSWDTPSRACLASRFPYGTQITAKRLAQVERAEDALYDLGFTQFRVRYHGDVARIEVGADEIDRFLSEQTRDKVYAAIKAAGFAYVALDLRGYRTGSLNETL